MADMEPPKEGQTTYRLETREVFESLIGDGSQKGKDYQVYVHHLARACWHGSRVMLRQTSPEAEGIFDFILALHRACKGQWTNFKEYGITQEDLDAWLEFSAVFLSGMGNYGNHGGRKVVPDVSLDALYKMASMLPGSAKILQDIIGPMTATQPAWLGYTAKTSQSGYYTGPDTITKGEIEALTRKLESERIAPENTRLQKHSQEHTYEILQASVEKDVESQFVGYVKIGDQRPYKVLLRRGDHSEEMAKICTELEAARQFATTDEQRTALSQMVESFHTGNYEAFKAAQRTWVTDQAPRIEYCMGFLFGYRDPHGVRAEWQAAAGIADKEGMVKMAKIVDISKDLIRTLPWAVPGVNDGKGPFEPDELDVPQLAIVHVLASVSCTVWEATNITITVTHELIGHGTGKLFVETLTGSFNFDKYDPPSSPDTGKPVTTWYKPGQTWNTVFGKLAPTVEECRAFLVAGYLADNKDILAIFGYDDESTPTADDILYCIYLQLGVEGLRALRSFNVSDQSWGGDHEQAQFAILKHLLQHGKGVIRVEVNPISEDLFVQVERSKIVTHGKPALGLMLRKLHIWRSTADVEACRPYYEALSVVDGEYETWRHIVVSKSEPKWKFVQPNTFLQEDGSVTLREYEASNAGIIKSFFERGI
ncbi:peptidase M49- dipeptidyl-peptidase III [Apiospora sp. TS-2023a]